MKSKKTKKLSTKQVKLLHISSKKKYLSCTKCGDDVEVDSETIAAKCYKCTLAMAPVSIKLTQKKERSKNPAGWRFMAEYVDAGGNVYYFGEVQPKLKGTKEISDVEAIRKDQKKKREETKKKKVLRAKMKEERLTKQYAKKQKAKKKAETKKKKQFDKLNGKTK